MHRLEPIKRYVVSLATRFFDPLSIIFAVMHTVIQVALSTPVRIEVELGPTITW